MPLVTRLFHFTTIAQAVGEGGISTGMSPLPWGPLGISVSGATTDATGQVLTRATGWLAGYTFASGDICDVTAGSSGTTLGSVNISAKNSSNALALASSIGANKTGVAARLLRNSLAGGLLDPPASLPGADTAPNTAIDYFTCFEPSSGSGTDKSLLLRFGGAQLAGVGTSLADVLAADAPSSIASVGFGVRMRDMTGGGTGVPYTTNIQLRNSGGAFGLVATSSDISQVFSDGGAAPSAQVDYYLQPGLIDASFAASVAQLSNAGFAVNFQLGQATGDSFEATPLLGVNGPVLKLVYNIGSSGVSALRGRWSDARSRLRGR